MPVACNHSVIVYKTIFSVLTVINTGASVFQISILFEDVLGWLIINRVLRQSAVLNAPYASGICNDNMPLTSTFISRKILLESLMNKAFFH